MSLITSFGLKHQRKTHMNPDAIHHVLGRKKACSRQMSSKAWKVCAFRSLGTEFRRFLVECVKDKFDVVPFSGLVKTISVKPWLQAWWEYIKGKHSEEGKEGGGPFACCMVCKQQIGGSPWSALIMGSLHGYPAFPRLPAITRLHARLSQPTDCPSVLKRRHLPLPW